MTAFSHLVHDLWAGDPNSTAAAIAKSLRLSARAQEVLLPVIADRARAEYRERARVIETTAFTGPTQPQIRIEFLASTFPLPDGSSVTWGAATPVDHMARIEFLMKLRSGIDVTIARHQKAIDVIGDRGVTCLGDLDPIEAEAVAA